MEHRLAGPLLRVAPTAQIEWLPRASDFAEEYGLDRTVFEAAARHPQRVEPDSSGVDHGYPVSVFHRGDIRAAVGFRDPDRPTLMYVWLDLPMKTKSGSGGVPGASAKAPTSVKGLLGYCQGRGCTLRASGGHTKVYKDDVYVGTVGGTVHGRTVTNDFQHIKKRLDMLEAAATIDAAENLEGAD